MSVAVKRFVVGFSIAAVVAVVVNLLPYLWTGYLARMMDGFVVAGFPFTFRRTGGIAYVDEFHADALLYDVVLALAVAILFGCFVASNEFRCLVGRNTNSSE